MGFIEKVTGSSMTKRFKECEERVKVLPKEYQEAWKEIKRIVAVSSKDFVDVMENILLLFEESVEENLTLNEVIGDDLNGFCSAITGKDCSTIFRDKWRKQLNNNVKNKLNKLNGEGR